MLPPHQTLVISLEDSVTLLRFAHPAKMIWLRNFLSAIQVLILYLEVRGWDYSNSYLTDLPDRAIRSLQPKHCT